MTGFGWHRCALRLRAVTVTAHAPAKVNLTLSVGPLEADGYHRLTTVYHALTLHDSVTAMPAVRPSIEMKLEVAGLVPDGDDNLAMRAVYALADATGHKPHVSLTVTKRIPIAAGLAGGSADAAAALVACNELWQTGLSTEELADVARGLGSDVPFALYGGTMLGTGRGDQLAPVLTPGTAAGSLHWVLAVSDEGLSTPAVYRRLDELRGTDAGRAEAELPRDMLLALRAGDIDGIAAAMTNDLQEAAAAMRPGLRRTLQAGLEYGATAALVTGSGPTCVFLSETKETADNLAVALSAEGVCSRVLRATGPARGAHLA
ncbi:MAG: 4-(cytidine 5'-diphospho)-2-C-methyl-D-erythritol kinase [Actinobacteria bacterium]|nr:4-(cytidine 5'-diphospho)-2-C-methyl-D-erythritol kinase [Actinomycetota bacterium]